MDECELIILISTLSCAIAKCCNDDELSILSAVFTQLGDSLATIITSRELKDKRLNNTTNKDQCDKADNSNILMTEEE